MTKTQTNQTTDQNIESLNVEPLEERNAPSMPPAVMYRLGDPAGRDAVILHAPDATLD